MNKKTIYKFDEARDRAIADSIFSNGIKKVIDD